MFTLVINPGSTSTKVAIYEDDKELHMETLSHSKEELSRYPTILDQLGFRSDLVMGFLEATGYPPSKLNCVVSRGGAPPDARSGATAINETLVTALRERPKEPHPACLGPIIAFKIAADAGLPAYMYDPISVDELNPLARVFGVKGIEHDSMCHVLNTRAMAIATAKELGRSFSRTCFIVAHFGGGNSVSCWREGLLHDVIPGDAGSFSAERCGAIRCERLIELSKKYDSKTITGWFHGEGGMVSLLGTNDFRDVEKMIAAGDEYALLCEQAMAYQLSKSIASLFPAVNGNVDGIILTGGGAYWKRLADDIWNRLEYLKTPIYIRPGENEMQSLAEGALRVMAGEEEAHTYGNSESGIRNAE